MIFKLWTLTRTVLLLILKLIFCWNIFFHENNNNLLRRLIWLIRRMNSFWRRHMRNSLKKIREWKRIPFTFEKMVHSSAKKKLNNAKFSTTKNVRQKFINYCLQSERINCFIQKKRLKCINEFFSFQKGCIISVTFERLIEKKWMQNARVEKYINEWNIPPFTRHKPTEETKQNE